MRVLAIPISGPTTSLGVACVPPGASPASAKTFSRLSWRGSYFPLWRSCLAHTPTSRAARNDWQDVPTPKAPTNPDPPLSVGPACHDSSSVAQGSHSIMLSVLWSPVGINSAGCYEEEIIKPARTRSSFPDVWGHVWERPVASGPKRTVWAPGCMANRLRNVTLSRWRLWLGHTHPSTS